MLVDNDFSTTKKHLSQAARLAIVAVGCVTLIACGSSSNKPKPVSFTNTNSTLGKGGTSASPSPSPTPAENGGENGGENGMGGQPGGISPTPTPTPTEAPVDTFEIGGTVEGLSDGEIVLSLNDTYSLTVSANNGSEKTFTFATELEQGVSYEVVIDEENNSDNRCKVFDGQGNVGSFAIDDILIKCVEKEVLYAVNVGGAAYTAGDISFTSDRNFSGGAIPDVSAEPIAGTTYDPLYQSERFGEAEDFSYDFSVEPGEYDVTLHFAELYFDGMEGRPLRAFNVRIEGNLKLSNYNPYQEAGSKRFAAVVEEIDGVVVADNDDELNIEFQFGPGNPQVSAIVIEGYPEITRN